MVVASTNEFRINQRKYLDLVRQNVQVFLKQGNDLFAITSVNEKQHIDVDFIRKPNKETLKAMQEAESGKELETLDLDNFKEYVASL